MDRTGTLGRQPGRPSLLAALLVLAMTFWVLPGAGAAVAASQKPVPAAAHLERTVKLDATVTQLVRTATSVLTLGSVHGRTSIERLDPTSLHVLAETFVPEAYSTSSLATARGRVAIVIAGAHPHLLVLRERDLRQTSDIGLPSQPSPGSDVAIVGDVAVVGLVARVVSIDVRRGIKQRETQFAGHVVQVAAVAGSIFAIDAADDHTARNPLLLDPVTLGIRTHLPTVELGFVTALTARGHKVLVTSSGGHFVGFLSVDVHGQGRAGATGGWQTPNGTIYVQGDHTVWASYAGLTCFDASSGRLLASTPSGAPMGQAVVETDRILVPHDGLVQIWTPTGPCQRT